MALQENNRFFTGCSIAAERKAMRRTGIFSAAGILLLLAAVSVIFYYEPDIAEAAPRKTGSFHMFAIEDIEAAQPGFSEWLDAADPKKFVSPAAGDSCRDHHWQKLRTGRNLPVTNVRLSRPAPAQEIQACGDAAAGKKVSFPASSWYSAASLPLGVAVEPGIIWEDGVTEVSWQPDGELLRAAAEAGVEMTTVIFHTTGAFPRIAIEDTASEDRQWRTALSREMLKLAGKLDPVPGVTRRGIIYWQQEER